MDEQKTPSTPPSGGQGPSASSDKDEEIKRLKSLLAESYKVNAEQANTIAEKDNTIAETNKINAEQANALQDMKMTKLPDYLDLVNRRVYDTFTVETDPSQLAQGTTSVAGKFYPRRLRRWADFSSLHDQKFQDIEDTLDPVDACFDSPYAISQLVTSFSPKSKNEATLRPFLRIALEKPAATIVNMYLRSAPNSLDDESPASVFFTDEDKKTATTPQPVLGNNGANKGGSSIPDRLCMRKLKNVGKMDVRFLVGEYKAAHRLPATKLQHMLESPPEDFLSRAAVQDKDVPKEDATDDVVFSNKYPVVYLAKALCQAYHYMIEGALEYGYIATGYGLLLLHVVPTDLDTLYYHCVTFALEGAQHPPLHPKQTAAAYMATLILLANRDTASTDDDIRAWAKDRLRWPDVKYDGKKGNLDCVLRSSSGKTDEIGTPVAKRWPLALDLPYCTQACLLGVVHQGPLDEKCPNVERHRAASLRMHGNPNRHPLTVDGIREALLVQAKAAATDPTQCCAQSGREGRYGALRRVAVTCAGYVFVAKATYTGCVPLLEHEMRVYEALKAYQGKLIPVCFGIMTFYSARFAADRMMRSLLFLSYAGRDLGHPERLPLNIDLQAAMDRTTKELYDLGLRNGDVRVYNCAWNPETRRVMHFDFDHAVMVGWKTGGDAVGKRKRR